MKNGRPAAPAARAGGHGGGRAGKHRKRPFDYGDLRLMVLALVAEEPSHGYELIKQIEKRFDGAYAPSPGAIYPTISSLEALGLVTVADDSNGRKLVQASDAGSAFLAANGETVESIWNRKFQLRRHNAPPAVVKAMDALKAAIHARLGNSPPAEAVTAVARDIQSFAEALAQGGPPAETLATTSGAAIVTRHRFETRRRKLEVKEAFHLTPHMVRIVLTGDDLADFVSLGADDHIKLFFPGDGDKPEMRDYTPRDFDTGARRLTIDFVIHDAGPASDWALAAKPGDRLEIGGPRGSSVISPSFDWWLLIGDETALPAIGRRVEELGAGVRVVTLAAVPGKADEQRFDSRADLQSHWVHRPSSEAASADTLIAALTAIDLPEGRGFVWIAAEASVARALRDHLTETRDHPRDCLKAAGYWVDGKAAASDKSLGGATAAPTTTEEKT